METIIIEFLLGIAIGTISGLLIVKFSGTKSFSKTTTGPRRLRATAQAAMPRPKARSVKPRTLHKARSRLIIEQTKPVSTTPNLAPVAQPVFASCPSCGLQAPELLMAEHFLGSPSHQFGPIPEATVAETSVGQSPVESVGEEDSRSSLRHLLQMLVPPRAFGRRHAERTVNPLSRLVQTLEESRSALVQPLKRP